MKPTKFTLQYVAPDMWVQLLLPECGFAASDTPVPDGIETDDYQTETWL